MNYPEAPTCHGDVTQNGIFNFGTPAWRPPREEETHRTCSYCGCVHPEDLLRLIAEGAKVGGSDWKYGWPHKFYVTTDSTAEKRGLFAKWYNEHLKDAGLDEEAFKVLTETLEREAGIRFFWKDKDGERVIAYAAPYFGYQKP